jgi:DNA-binding transcriptional MerR regulator
MKSIKKKLIGCFMVVMIVSTIGAVLVSANDDETQKDELFEKPYGFRKGKGNLPPFFKELTEEQREEIHNIVSSLKGEGAYFEEIREVVNAKLEEWGIEISKPERTDEQLDEILENKITRATQRLEVLKRVQELRDEGYSYEEIKDIIQEEFDLEKPIFGNQGIRNCQRSGFKRGFGNGLGPVDDPEL